MKVLNPQSAILSNVEVLAHFTLNPPRRSPNPPPNSNPRNYTPSPDLRDHNTVVKEFHDYVTRLSPHLLKYPSFDPNNTSVSTAAGPQTETQLQTVNPARNEIDPSETPLDIALRTLITRLKPFQLTKGEVLMMINLGIGLGDPDQDREQVDGADVEDVNGATEYGANDSGVGGEEDTVMPDGGEADAVDGEMVGGEEDYGAMAILNTVIEDRAERLTDEDVLEILRILRETLGGKTISRPGMDDAAG